MMKTGLGQGVGLSLVCAFTLWAGACDGGKAETPAETKSAVDEAGSPADSPSAVDPLAAAGAEAPTKAQDGIDAEPVAPQDEAADAGAADADAAADDDAEAPPEGGGAEAKDVDAAAGGSEAKGTAVKPNEDAQAPRDAKTKQPATKAPSTKEKEPLDDGDEAKDGASPEPSAGAPNGREIFAKKCKNCHGADGTADTNIGRKHEIESWKTPGWSTKWTLAKVEEITREGKPDTKMKAFKDKLTPEEITAVAKYARSLGG